MVEGLAATIRRFNDNACIVLASPVPRPHDDQKVVAMCVNIGKVVRVSCARVGIEYSWIAQQFYSKLGLKQNLYSRMGVSATGNALVKSVIFNKINSF